MVSQQSASGGNDTFFFFLPISDRSMASSNSPTHRLHELEDHTSCEKPLLGVPSRATC